MDKLTLIADALGSVPGIQVLTRGQGAASFLYVRSDQRAVEVSLDDDDAYVEYWDVADEESDEAAVREQSFDDPNAAVQSIKEWLE